MNSGFASKCCHGRHGGEVVGAVASKQEGHGFDSRFRVFLCGVWTSVSVLFGFSDFLPLCGFLLVTPIVHNHAHKARLEVSVNGCLPPCDPAMNQPLVQGVTLPSPSDSLQKFQQ